MVYLDEFIFPDEEMEFDFFMTIKRKCYDTFYPFKVLSRNKITRIVLEPITIFYGNNGSGKTTALNIIAEKLKLLRESNFNKSNFYQDYVDMCQMRIIEEIPSSSRIITSDDVFDFMLNIRNLNEGIDNKRDELFGEYLDAKYSQFKMTSLSDYEQLKKVNQSRSKTQSKYVKNNLMSNIREFSNGESAFMYFTEKIGENGLFVLDEPENSLAPERQLELVKFLEDSVRYFGCQFIISTHSPFILALNGAKIYDFDEKPVNIKSWTELKNVRSYYEFFKYHENEF